MSVRKFPLHVSAIVIDLDGTLLHTAPELAEALGPTLNRQDWRTNWRTTAYLRAGDRALYFAGPVIRPASAQRLSVVRSPICRRRTAPMSLFSAHNRSWNARTN